MNNPSAEECDEHHNTSSRSSCQANAIEAVMKHAAPQPMPRKTAASSGTHGVPEMLQCHPWLAWPWRGQTIHPTAASLSPGDPRDALAGEGLGLEREISQG